MTCDRYCFYSNNPLNMGSLVHRNKDFVHKSVPTNQNRAKKMLGDWVPQKSCAHFP